ncbi:hypothetical protein AVL62_04750 [Serinicoccus chungangensis]|uniref:Uncharacterized protein n=1 Tax=Serinicoccus chungangensis TaxID=767452 RepID=A0A0W8I899_9MICO|nr:hypothetical protein AVL62_04750 [Serinicoccus chungangensis]
MSQVAEERWAHLIRVNSLDDDVSQQLEIVTMTYCVEQVDTRRVVVAFDGQRRTVFPLWWDQRHEVSGSDGTVLEPQACESEHCHHKPWSDNQGTLARRD